MALQRAYKPPLFSYCNLAPFGDLLCYMNFAMQFGNFPDSFVGPYCKIVIIAQLHTYAILILQNTPVL